MVATREDLNYALAASSATWPCDLPAVWTSESRGTMAEVFAMQDSGIAETAEDKAAPAIGGLYVKN
jgi:hypothetical protein